MTSWSICPHTWWSRFWHLTGIYKHKIGLVAQAWLRHGELEGLLRCEVHLAAASMKRNQHAVNAMRNRLGGGARAEFLLNSCVYALIGVEWAVNVKLMLTNILLDAG